MHWEFAEVAFALQRGIPLIVPPRDGLAQSQNITGDTMSDSFWQSVRYVLIAVGSYFAGKGKIDASQVAPLADQIIQIGGMVVAVVTAVWGFWVKFRTATVPAAVAARSDVPTVSAATGAKTS